MTKPLIRIHNIEANEILDREMTDEEFAQYQIDKAQYEESMAKEIQKNATRQALLDKLGITEDEAKLLLS